MGVDGLAASSGAQAERDCATRCRRLWRGGHGATEAADGAAVAARL